MNGNKNGIKTALFYFVLAAVLLGLIIIWQLFFKDISYYVPSAILLVFSLLPVFFSFERRKSSSREITLTASLVALAVVSRAAFYLIPEVKPIAAVVIVSAVCLGAEKGYTVGVFSAFVSNFIFGQGPWTPFQMTALGLVGFVSGLVFKYAKCSRVNLAVTGFVLAFALYGAIADISTILVIYGKQLTLRGLLSVYAAGAPFSFAFGLSTAVFLFVIGTPLINKLNRVIIKYNIIEKG